ncbi:hypothetical protein OIU78_019076 [Salix suchowensis]|nr:hypothetical protein OIU78_019076 [Salix suchowensis]
MKEGKFSAKLNNSNNQQHQNGHLSPFKLAKLLDPEASWDKDQLGDVLHWIRQFVALVCGLLWGAIPLVGVLEKPALSVDSFVGYNSSVMSATPFPYSSMTVNALFLGS